MVEVPIISEMLPVIVSTRNSDRFIRVDKMSTDNNVRVGLFQNDSPNLDAVVVNALRYIKTECESLKYGNVFSSYSKAVDHILGHVTLDDDETLISAGPEVIPNNSERKVRHIPIDMEFGCVFSVPDFVGLNVVFSASNYSGIIFHNIRKGLAFIDLQSIKQSS